MRLLSVIARTMAATQWHPAGIKPQRTALESLKARKDAFLGDAAGPLACWTCCLGSSAGDLDSLASALAAAHACNGTAVARFRREDLALRKDCQLALGEKGAEALLYEDEITDEVAAKREPKTTLVLVDHNRFDAQSLQLGDRIICVMDHHRDEGQHKDAIDREVDETCGSCSSLLAERMAAYMEPDLARILLAAVAIDCRGFDPKVRGTKFSGRDVKAAHSLLDVLGPKVSDRSEDSLRARPIPSGVFDAATIPDLAKLLGAARHDVTGLTAAQLIALDYKSAVAGDGTKIGAASILTPFADQAGAWGLESTETEVDYKAHRKRVRSSGQTLADSVLSYFTDGEVAFTPALFPYALPPEVRHWILWVRQTSYDAWRRHVGPAAELRQQVRRVYGRRAAGAMAFVQNLEGERSIAAVPHYHVFVVNSSMRSPERSVMEACARNGSVRCVQEREE